MYCNDLYKIWHFTLGNEETLFLKLIYWLSARQKEGSLIICWRDLQAISTADRRLSYYMLKTFTGHASARHTEGSRIIMLKRFCIYIYIYIYIIMVILFITNNIYLEIIVYWKPTDKINNWCLQYSLFLF